MRGLSGSVDELFSFVRLEERAPPDHPLRVIHGWVDEVLADLSGDLSALSSVTGRPRGAMRRGVSMAKDAATRPMPQPPIRTCGFTVSGADSPPVCYRRIC